MDGLGDKLEHRPVVDAERGAAARGTDAVRVPVLVGQARAVGVQLVTGGVDGGGGGGGQMPAGRDGAAPKPAGGVVAGNANTRSYSGT